MSLTYALKNVRLFVHHDPEQCQLGAHVLYHICEY